MFPTVLTLLAADDAPQMTLECQFQGKLDRTGPANLIQRVETSRAGGSAAKGLIQELGRSTKRGTSDICSRRSKVRMVEHIEQLRSELYRERFVNWKIAMHSKIPLCRAEAAQRVSPEISLSSRSAL